MLRRRPRRRGGRGASGWRRRRGGDVAETTTRSSGDDGTGAMHVTPEPCCPKCYPRDVTESRVTNGAETTATAHRSCWRATRDAWRRRDDDDGGDDDCGDDDCAGRGGDDDAGGAPEGTELRGDNGCGDDGAAPPAAALVTESTLQLRHLVSSSSTCSSGFRLWSATRETDCLGFQDLPKKFWPAVKRLTRLTHPDGTPVYRCEQVEQLWGRHQEPEIEARPPQRRGWERVEDPVAHCLRGRSLLLTGLPGTGKTHLARRIVEQLREAGDVVFGAGRADRGPLGARHGAHVWPAWRWIAACASCFWATSCSCGGAGGPRGGGCCHELTENRRSDDRIFRFIAWLRVGEPEEVPLARRARVPAAGGRRAPRRVPGDLPRPQGAGERAGEPAPGAPTDATCCSTPAGLRHDQRAGGRRRQGGQGHLRAGGRADAERVVLDGGLQFTHAELLRHTHAVVPRHHLRQLPGADAPPGLRSAWHQRSSCTGRGTQKKGCTPLGTSVQRGLPTPRHPPGLEPQKLQGARLTRAARADAKLSCRTGSFFIGRTACASTPLYGVPSVGRQVPQASTTVRDPHLATGAHPYLATGARRHHICPLLLTSSPRRSRSAPPGASWRCSAPKSAWLDP